MNYLYHLVPKNMEGEILFPLTQLKERFPDAYVFSKKKYEGREHIMEQKIPILNCLWNDVLHLSPVHPKEIKNALLTSGKKDIPSHEYFEIDPRDLKPENTIIYLYKEGIYNRDISLAEFAEYEADKIKQYASIPTITMEYYKDKIAKGEKPLLFWHIPHILFKGSINTSKVRKILI